MAVSARCGADLRLFSGEPEKDDQGRCVEGDADQNDATALCPQRAGDEVSMLPNGAAVSGCLLECSCEELGMNEDQRNRNDLCPGVTVTLPHGAKVLSANASVPKTARGCLVAARKKQKAKRTAKTLAWALTLKCLNGSLFKPNRYMIRWFFKYGEAPDEDNTVARCKAYLDGACQAMGMDDRILRIRGVERIRDRQRAGEVDLVFWYEKKEESL